MEETSATTDSINEQIDRMKNEAMAISELSRSGAENSREVMQRANHMQETTQQATTRTEKMYNEVKSKFSDINIHITYGAETKEQRRAFDITKSHVNDAFVMGQFHPKHRSRPVCYKKKHRNNRCLEKFYDAKYIDSRDGKKRSGQELFNGRINRNHKKDSENLHQYRQQKVSAGRRTIRKQHYSIQPHDIVVFNRQQFETSGCHCNGARAILLPQKKSVAIKKLSIHKYAGGYFKSDFT